MRFQLRFQLGSQLCDSSYWNGLLLKISKFIRTKLKSKHVHKTRECNKLEKVLQKVLLKIWKLSLSNRSLVLSVQETVSQPYALSF